jgi:hypothetical protein
MSIGLGMAAWAGSAGQPQLGAFGANMDTLRIVATDDERFDDVETNGPFSSPLCQMTMVAIC